MKWLYLLLGLLIIANIHAITLPSRDSVNFILRDITLPQRSSTNFIIDPVDGATGPTTNTTTINQECTSITLYHNQNLSCQFNASSTENSLSWVVNDSRVTMVSNNNTGYLVDNPTLSEFNMNGCWSLNVTVNGSNSMDTSIVSYCIDDRSPSFNTTIAIINSSLTAHTSFTGIFFDSENDAVSMSLNCSVVGISIDNSAYTYNISYAGNATVGMYTCKLNATDTVRSTASTFTVNITSAGNSTTPSNISRFIPDTVVKNQTRNATLNTFTEYIVSFKNMTIANPLFNVTNTGASVGNVVVQRNETRSDIIIGCACSFSPSSRINLTGTNNTAICTINVSSSRNVWCWTDFVDFNATNRHNVSFLMTATVG